MKKNGFNAIIDNNSKILILGSFPSVKSREISFYYGNKQNRFWKMLEFTFNKKIEDNVDSKIKFLLSYNIALWDIVKSSNIKNSDDKTLEKSNYELNQIDLLLKEFPNIKKIICNGKLAYELVVNNFKLNIPVVYLTSTSPANPRFKYELWKEEILK
ncbi:MAG: DNA-deoxyinosine glycosylase [Clostridia bacterium]|nr:DNA-deoxyinosine glycosylase [Clostridia bacterium]